MAKDRIAGMLLWGLGLLTVGTGIYFMAVRPAMLPEDLRFTGASAPAAGSAMETWLRLVFRTWGGFVIGFGVLIGATGGFLLTAQRGWLRAGVAIGVMLAFSQFLASNLQLHSDFLWFVGSLFVLAVGTTALVIRSQQGGID
jgi:hypothetical protein